MTTAPPSPMPKGSSRRWRVLRVGKGADLLMIDVDPTSAAWCAAGSRAHPPPIVACGISTDARAAVAAIHAGAKEYIPLPPDPELIAAVLAAVADDCRDLVYRDGDGAR